VTVPIHLGGTILLSLDEIRAEFPADHRPSLETLRRYIRSRLLGGHKVGTSWYCTQRALDRFFEGEPPPTDTAQNHDP